MTNQPRCPKCGKYQENEPDGFYAKTSDDEFAPVEVFCNEECYEKYAAAERASKLPNHPKSIYTPAIEDGLHETIKDIGAGLDRAPWSES